MTQQGTRRARNAGLVAALIALLLVAAAGCGTKHGESANAGKAKTGSSQSVLAKITRFKNKVWRKLASIGKPSKATASKTTTPESTAPKSTVSESTAPKSTASKSTASRSTASKHTASKSTARKRTASKSMASRRTASKHAHATVAAHHASAGHRATASRGAHIRLTQKGCIEFEPQWTAIRVGQSLTWHSRLKRRVTIHVTPGAFGRAAYVVSAGGSVSTGPARGVGAFSMWCQPAACQGTPRGARGSGPGVTIVRRGG